MSYQNSMILQKLWILNICNAVLPQHFQIKELSIPVYLSWTFFPPLPIYLNISTKFHILPCFFQDMDWGMFSGCKLQGMWELGVEQFSPHNLLTAHQQCSDEFLGIQGNLYVSGCSEVYCLYGFPLAELPGCMQVNVTSISHGNKRGTSRYKVYMCVWSIWITSKLDLLDL